MIYEFIDEDGRQHVHPIDTGPYVRKPLTCESCIAIIEAQRAALCEKYGWKEWPFKEDK